MDALNGVDALAIQKRGRWAAVASGRWYEKKGRILKQLAILGPGRARESADELIRLQGHLPSPLHSALAKEGCYHVPARPPVGPRGARWFWGAVGSRALIQNITQGLPAA